MIVQLRHVFGIQKISQVKTIPNHEALNVTVNTFLANVSILYPLNTPENLWFSGVFRGYKMETLTKNDLNRFCILIYCFHRQLRTLVSKDRSVFRTQSNIYNELKEKALNIFFYFKKNFLHIQKYLLKNLLKYQLTVKLI